MDSEEVLLTQEGYDKLEQELEYLKTTQRTEIAGRIKVALGYGDLSENSEYDEAKNAQEMNENKITELENKLRHAKIIDSSEIDTKTVQVGNTVEVLDMDFDENVTYTIVGSTEVDLAQNKISNGWFNILSYVPPLVPPQLLSIIVASCVVVHLHCTVLNIPSLSITISYHCVSFNGIDTE